jgi:hypothetical protein
MLLELNKIAKKHKTIDDCHVEIATFTHDIVFAYDLAIELISGSEELQKKFLQTSKKEYFTACCALLAIEKFQFDVLNKLN